MSATLSHPSSAATTVTVTAVSGFYTASSDATITIAAGETANASDGVTVTAVDDAIDNVGDRSVTVTGTAANAQATADSQILTVNGASLTLTDDEATADGDAGAVRAGLGEAGHHRRERGGQTRAR